MSEEPKSKFNINTYKVHKGYYRAEVIMKGEETVKLTFRIKKIMRNHWVIYHTQIDGRTRGQYAGSSLRECISWLETSIEKYIKQ